MHLQTITGRKATTKLENRTSATYFHLVCSSCQKSQKHIDKSALKNYAISFHSRGCAMMPVWSFESEGRATSKWNLAAWGEQQGLVMWVPPRPATSTFQNVAYTKVWLDAVCRRTPIGGRGREGRLACRHAICNCSYRVSVEPRGCCVNIFEVQRHVQRSTSDHPEAGPENPPQHDAHNHQIDIVLPVLNSPTSSIVQKTPPSSPVKQQHPCCHKIVQLLAQVSKEYILDDSVFGQKWIEKADGSPHCSSHNKWNPAASVIVSWNDVQHLKQNQMRTFHHLLLCSAFQVSHHNCPETRQCVGPFFWKPGSPRHRARWWRSMDQRRGCSWSHPPRTGNRETAQRSRAPLLSSCLQPGVKDRRFGEIWGKLCFRGITLSPSVSKSGSGDTRHGATVHPGPRRKVPMFHHKPLPQTHKWTVWT